MTPREMAEFAMNNVVINGEVMTARVASIYWGAHLDAIEKQIVAAIEAEREACARVADDAGPTFYHKQMCEAAKSIADEIRARGESEGL